MNGLRYAVWYSGLRTSIWRKKCFSIPEDVKFHKDCTFRNSSTTSSCSSRIVRDDADDDELKTDSEPKHNIDVSTGPGLADFIIPDSFTRKSAAPMNIPYIQDYDGNGQKGKQRLLSHLKCHRVFQHSHFLHIPFS